MSIILKGIDIPKDGEWLEVIIKPTKEVIVDTIRYRDNALLKTEYEPAIQIPTPHGRLIDGDELKEKYSNWLEAVPFVNNSLADMGRRDVLISVNHDLTYSAPTILEAEGEDVHKSNV